MNNFKDTNPLVVPVKFKDAPEKSVSEYFESKCKGIKVIKEPDWDRVPWSPAQGLQEASRELESTKSEFSNTSCEQKQRLAVLQKQWQDMQTLELELKNCFLETESKIKSLKEISETNSEEVRGEKMLEREQWLEMKISQLHRAKERIEDETTRLQPYKDFVTNVATTSIVYKNPSAPISGAQNVLYHYERLCDTQEELETRQATALEQLHQLRNEAQSFTAQALSKLDAQQAQVASLKEQVKIESEKRDECVTKLGALRTISQLSDAEESQLRASITNLYEQLWKRYHPKQPIAPSRDISGETSYIQHILVGLERFVEARKQSDPSINSTLEPQLSQTSHKKKIIKKSLKK